MIPIPKKKIIHTGNALSMSNLSDKFKNADFEVVFNVRSNSLKLTKNGQSMGLRAFKGDKVFELEAQPPFYYYIVFIPTCVLCAYLYVKFEAIKVISVFAFVFGWFTHIRMTKFDAPCQVLFDEIRDILKGS